MDTDKEKKDIISALIWRAIVPGSLGAVMVIVLITIILVFF